MLVQPPQNLAGRPRHGLGMLVAHVTHGGDVADLARVEAFSHRSTPRIAAPVGPEKRKNTLFSASGKGRRSEVLQGARPGGAAGVLNSSIRARANSAKNVSR